MKQLRNNIYSFFGSLILTFVKVIETLSKSVLPTPQRVKKNILVLLLMRWSVAFSFLLFLLFIFPYTARANLAEDLIAREGWKTISLDFDGASLLNILKLFSQQSGLNFVASPTVSGKSVTLYLENVPLREALEKILNANKLTYELDENSNIFIVKELIRPEVDLITKVFFLKYARLSKSPINTASATKHSGLVEAIRDRMSSYGKMTEDTRTNSLIISDTPVYLKEIEAAIKALDVPIPQVIIEVEIIDTSKSLVENLGFDWNGAGSLFTYALPNYTFPDTVKYSPVGSALSGGGTPFSGFIGGSSKLILQQLITHSETKILARPKILTLSNEKAEIKITGHDVISSEKKSDAQGVVTQTNIEREDIGVQLTVTPSVNIETGEITMVLEPKVTAVEESAFRDATGNVFLNPQERSAKVTVIAKNNQTVVLGGLLREDVLRSQAKVFFLGDIPFLGALFRNKSNKPQSREMLVFITPRIVDSAGESLIQTAQSGADYNQEILAGREQTDYTYRKEEIDKELMAWDK